MEVQLKKIEQQLSKQITEEWQAVQLRSGKTLNTSLQSSRKPRNEQTATQNPSEDSKSPERNVIGVQTPERGERLALNAHSLPSSGVQTPEKGEKLALNAHFPPNPGVQTPREDQTPESADSNPSKKASSTTSVRNKPAASKVEEYKAKMPYPQKLRQAEQDKQFARFADYLRTLEIKIPFAEALEQIPSYAKFMKDILSHKKDGREAEIVLLTEECSVVIQKSLPEKLKDPILAAL